MSINHSSKEQSPVTQEQESRGSGQANVAGSPRSTEEADPGAGAGGARGAPVAEKVVEW